MEQNILFNADSYKDSHFLQDPPRTQKKHFYVESRGGRFDKTLYVGHQMFIKDYLLRPITMANIIEAEEMTIAHGEPFNKEGWLHVLNHHGGYLPLSIRALPEGSLVPTHNALATVENTDLEHPEFGSFIETSFLRAIWYPTTVATISYYIKQTILKYLEETGDPGLIDFKLHNFGDRGVSSLESAGIGGLAHLVNFKGTDGKESLRYARYFYNEPMAGFSIIASEHSTITIWGREHETDAYRNMLRFLKPGSMVACVSDSYDIYNAVENIWGGTLKQDILKSGGTLVIRPDSGNPAEVVLKVAEILWSKFGGKLNVKGYRVLHPSVRIIQGDGINMESIGEILEVLKQAGFSADNIAFGMGGALLQQMDRDTQRFAMKCSAAQIDYHWRDVFKDPVTDTGKRSKKGVLTTTYKDETFRTLNILDPQNAKLIKKYDAMQEVYRNGQLLVDESLKNIRERADFWRHMTFIGG